MLLVYRDGVSDTELQYVRSDEVSSILAVSLLTMLYQNKKSRAAE